MCVLYSKMMQKMLMDDCLDVTTGNTDGILNESYQE